jgi:hypothetical protein
MAAHQPRDFRQDPNCPVPLEMLGRLYRASEAVVHAATAELSDRRRAELALFCYARNHLRELGLAIARTCDENTLALAGGRAGAVLFAQARTISPPEFGIVRAASEKPKISLGPLPAAMHRIADAD